MTMKLFLMAWVVLTLSGGHGLASLSSFHDALPPPPKMADHAVFFGEMAHTDALYIEIHNDTPHKIVVSHSGQMGTKGIASKCVAGLCQFNEEARFEVEAKNSRVWTLPAMAVPTGAGPFTMEVMGRINKGWIPSITTCSFDHVHRGDTLAVLFKMISHFGFESVTCQPLGSGVDG